MGLEQHFPLSCRRSGPGAGIVAPVAMAPNADEPG